MGSSAKKAPPPAYVKRSVDLAKPEPSANLTEALANQDFPEEIVRDQAVVEVQFYGFDDQLHHGEIVVRKDLAGDVKAIFDEIRDSHFPISKVVPISHYDWNDDRSVLDDNTSGFNYRLTPGHSRLSKHAYGVAIDVNPYQNPYFAGSRNLPHTYDPSVKGTLTPDCPVVKAFKKRGWMWGGDWRSGRDYQHFEYAGG